MLYDVAPDTAGQEMVALPSPDVAAILAGAEVVTVSPPMQPFIMKILKNKTVTHTHFKNTLFIAFTPSIGSPRYPQFNTSLFPRRYSVIIR